MSESDFHICSKSSVTNTDIDQRGVEYFGESLSEGCYGPYSVSTLISWQHFPRSTSSRCDESFLQISRSVSDTLTDEGGEEEQEATELAPELPFVWQSKSGLKATHYLEIRHVYEFLNFLMGHLICNEPDDPIEFLDDLLGKCLRFRDSFGDPPCLFKYSHIKTLYRAFDPFERGYITLIQYKEGMRSLGLIRNITPFNDQPHLNSEGYVEESEFVFEAGRCLTENLKQMLRVPKFWEDNPQMWKKRMAKFNLELQKTKDIEFEKKNYKEEEEEDKYFDKKFGVKFHTPPVTRKVKPEFEQLFLDCCTFCD